MDLEHVKEEITPQYGTPRPSLGITELTFAKKAAKKWVDSLQGALVSCKVYKLVYCVPSCNVHYEPLEL